MNILYKEKSNNSGAECTKCGKWASNPVWIGFENEYGEIVESPYGSCCARKFSNSPNNQTNKV